MVWLAEIYNLRKAAVGIESRKLGLLVLRFLSITTAFPCSTLYCFSGLCREGPDVLP